MAKTEVKLTCVRCKRPVGRLGRCLARAYTFEVTSQGVGPVCKHSKSCKDAK